MKKIVLFATSALLLVSSCKKNDTEQSKNYALDGYAQKGPFVSGANVIIAELDNNLEPTGKTFLSTTDNNMGHFAFPNVSFSSKYVQLKVEGQCYNEVLGGVEMSPLTLSSIVDISDNANINVNVLTQFEQARIKTLLKAGKTFVDARNQAHTEILAVFSIDNNSIKNSEQLDLTTSNVDGGVLLFISSIISGQIGSTMLFQEFITNMTTDFSDNGIIDSESIKTIIANSVYTLDQQLISSRIVKRYNDNGKTINPYQISYFKKQFLANTKYNSDFKTSIPAVVDNAINLLSGADTIKIDKSSKYCFSANFDDKVLSSLGINITSNDTTAFKTSNATWYANGSAKGLLFMSNTTIPITFTDKGSMYLEYRPMLKRSMDIIIKKYIVWE